MNENPWSAISPSSNSSIVSALRADPNAPWDFFWALDVDRHCLLILRHSAEPDELPSLPKLRGMDVASVPAEPGGTAALVLRLLDGAQRDIFHRLCLDIMQAAASATTERQAVSLTISRTWRWHHLLRGGSSDLLTAEEQKGLIGELLVLETVFIQSITTIDAVGAWIGPTGSPKDFEVGQVCVEVKARRAGANQRISISSESQLDSTGLKHLFLHVVDLTETHAADQAGLTVSDHAFSVGELILATDPGASALFEARLHAAGFQWEHDYSGFRWTQGDQHTFLVTEGFPRVTTASIPSGVSHVTYSVSLPECLPFLTDLETVRTSLLGE
jgi:hypothetical protein